jgi:uncharacterized protein YkwD
MSAPRPISRPRVRRLATILSLAVVLAASGVAPASTAAAVSGSSVEAAILSLVNRDRAALGLRPLRRDTRLATLADRRAANLAASRTFSHAAAGGDVGVELDRAGVQWYVWGEVLAYRSGGLTSRTAAAIYGAWRNSDPHWSKLMSRTFNYIGFGTAVRTSNPRVFAVAVLTESRDHTAPRAEMLTATRSGTTITFTWRGWDPALQSHWAGLRDFDVWYRVDKGAWRRIRDNTTATSLSLSSRTPGHLYELAVSARDRAGNIGKISAPLGIRVP